MYYRRYIPGSSRVIRRGAVIPRRGVTIRSVVRRTFADCSWPPLQFDQFRREAPSLPVRGGSANRRDRRRSPLILIGSHNWPIRGRHTIHPIDRRSCYEELNETSDADRCDPSILPFPASFSLGLPPRAPRALSISNGDPRRCSSPFEASYL
jgi:hypothetical protein